MLSNVLNVHRFHSICLLSQHYLLTLDGDKITRWFFFLNQGYEMDILSFSLSRGLELSFLKKNRTSPELASSHHSLSLSSKYILIFFFSFNFKYSIWLEIFFSFFIFPAFPSFSGFSWVFSKFYFSLLSISHIFLF